MEPVVLCIGTAAREKDLPAKLNSHKPRDVPMKSVEFVRDGGADGGNNVETAVSFVLSTEGGDGRIVDAASWHCRNGNCVLVLPIEHSNTSSFDAAME